MESATQVVAVVEQADILQEQVVLVLVTEAVETVQPIEAVVVAVVIILVLLLVVTEVLV
jgi:hypothetical protein